MMNTFGNNFRLTTYGESHGPAVGGIVDGCPAGLTIDFDALRNDLARRHGGTGTTERHEADEVRFLSGLKDGVTLGTPIAFEIDNTDVRSDDYAPLEHFFRPGHADYTYYKKYGIREYRGGGRASARETVARVVAGAIARQLLAPIVIEARVDSLGPDLPDDTRGGTVSCRVTGLPAGIGDPIFDKLNARLAAAMMSIPSATGFEIGTGFASAQMTGSQYIDRWNTQSPVETRPAASHPVTQSLTKTNHCGGLQGGITNGMPLEFRVAFHPVATLPQPVECLGDDGSLRTLTLGGRHDRCHVLRAPVVVEAMTALTLADLIIKS